MGQKHHADTETMQPGDFLPTGFDRWCLRYWPVPTLAPWALLVASSTAAGWGPRSDLSDTFFLGTTITVGLCAWLSGVARHRVATAAERVFTGRRLGVAGDVGAAEMRSKDAFEADVRVLVRSPSRWAVFALLVGVACLFTWAAAMLDPPGGTAHPIASRVHRAARWFLAPSLWAYFGGVLVWSSLATGGALRRLIERTGLHLDPIHPDGCGGLEPVGAICLWNAAPTLLGFAYVVSAVVYLGMQPPLPRRDAELFFALVACLAGLVILWTSSWQPLRTTRRAMLRLKAEGLRSLDSEYERVAVAAASPVAVEAQERRFKLAKARSELAAAPTWPVRLQLWRWFSRVASAAGFVAVVHTLLTSKFTFESALRFFADLK